MSTSSLLCCVRQGLLSAVNDGEVKSRLLFESEAIEVFHGVYIGRREAAQMLVFSQKRFAASSLQSRNGKEKYDIDL